VSPGENASAKSDGDGARGMPALSADEARIWLVAIVESTRDAIIGTDVKGGITSWNNAAEAMFGFAAGEIVGQSFRAVIPADRMDEETAILERICNGDKIASFETVHRHKNGTVFPVSVSVAPIRNNLGRIVGILKIVRNLSEIHLVRRALEQRETLLQQPHNMADIGDLAAGAEHDFNNVLQTVVNALELVLDDVAEDTPARMFAEIAIKTAVRGASLASQMLSRDREHAAPPTIVDLRPFLHDIRELLGHTLGPHIAVTINVEGNPSVLADPGQLQAALLNLAINASHAMPGGGALTMAASIEYVDGQPCVVVGFTDTANGTNGSTLAEAARPFFITTGRDGKGIGLSLVHSFAERSGGSLRVASASGQGTTVRLCLPANPADHRDVRQKAPANLQSSGRILLVDDLTDMLLTLTAALARAGFEVTPADSGVQALAILTADGPFDVLITDFAMPGMNGAELITRCRTVQPGLRALVITGFGEATFADTLPKGTDVLRKPVQRKELVETVNNLMKRDPDGSVTPYNGQTGRPDSSGNEQPSGLHLPGG
jgi:PAS domain S-box-containing protein